VYSAIVRLVGIGSILSCTIVIASFSLFAVNQTSTASTHQQQELKAEAAPSTAAGTVPSPALARSHRGSIRSTIDEASEWLSSPFAGLTSGSHSEWAVRSVDLVLALFVYGFCVGFARRLLRVRI
jgi:hypothetical protein